MAKTERIIALDVGSQQVSGASFSKTAEGGLRLDDYHRAPLVGNPFDDDVRNSQIELALKEVASSLKIKNNAPTTYIISSHPVFTKFVGLPAIEGGKVEEIVGFEAEQSIPYPLNDVVWGYQLVGDPGDFEVEAIIAAIKKDELDEIDGLIEGSGIRSAGAEISPFAHYNALRFNYSDIDQPIVLIDIGARMTDVIFMEGDDSFFIRTIKRGGAEITNAIAGEFGADFSSTEFKKMNDGFVALGGPYADHDDPEIAAMSKIIRNSLGQLCSEVIRTINFYRSQQGGNPPQIALLAGASTSLPYIREFFAEKLNIPVDHFNALRNVTVSSKVLDSGIANQAHMMGALVGSALHQSVGVPATIDLVPGSVEANQGLAKRKPYLWMTTAAITALLLGLGMFYMLGDKKFNEKAGVEKGLFADLTKHNNLIEKYTKEIEVLGVKQAPLVDSVQARLFWIDTFNYLNDKFSTDYMWITSITPMAEGKAVLDNYQFDGSSDNKITEIVLEGLWRENQSKSGVVSQYFSALKADAEKSVKANQPPRFDMADKEESDLTTIDRGLGGDRYAYGWKILLPIPPERQISYTK